MKSLADPVPPGEKLSIQHDVEIEVTFSREESRFWFAAFETEGDILVTEDGDITVPYSGPVRLIFNLSSQSQMELEGIQLGWFGPALLNTDGGDYPMPQHPDPMPASLSFRLESIDLQKQTLIVEDLQDPPCDVVSYQLFVRDPQGGGVFRHDPKIYNKGNGGPWPEPAQSRD